MGLLYGVVGTFFLSFIIILMDLILNWESFLSKGWHVSKTMICITVAWCVIGVIFFIAYAWVWLSNYIVISRKRLREIRNWLKWNP